MAQTVLHIGAEASAADFLAAYVRSPYVDRVILAAEGEASTDLRRRFGIIKAYAEDAREALAGAEAGIVSLSVPLREQPGLAMEALRAGKDVLCAAPPAETVTEAEEVIRVVEVTDRRLLCALHEPILPAAVGAGPAAGSHGEPAGGAGAAGGAPGAPPGAGASGDGDGP